MIAFEHLTSAHRARLFTTALLRAQEDQGHEFHGNQYTNRGVKEPNPEEGAYIDPRLGRPATPHDLYPNIYPEESQRFRDVIDTLRGVPLTVYHGTASQALASIKEKGLIARGSTGADQWAKEAGYPQYEWDAGDRPQSVFVTKNVNDALMFARYAADVNPGSEPVVLKVRVPGSEVTRLKTDEKFTGVGAYRYPDHIKPEWIKGRLEIKSDAKVGLFVGRKITALVAGDHVLYLTFMVQPEPKTLEEVGHEFHGNQYANVVSQANRLVNHLIRRHGAGWVDQLSKLHEEGFSVEDLLATLPNVPNTNTVDAKWYDLEEAGHPFHGNQWTSFPDVMQIGDTYTIHGRVVTKEQFEQHIKETEHHRKVGKIIDDLINAKGPDWVAELHRLHTKGGLSELYRTAEDVGHEFHGNQWTGATSVDELIAQLPRRPGRTRIDLAGVFGRSVQSSGNLLFGGSGEVERDQGVQRVPVNKLVPTQPTIGAGSGPGSLRAHLLGTAHGRKDEIDVTERGGYYYIRDGHHRAVAAILRGEQTVSANVWTIEPESTARQLEDEGHPFHGNQWTNAGPHLTTIQNDRYGRVPDVMYRGTSPRAGRPEERLPDAAVTGGELGGGLYTTADKAVADGYWEGPGHVTHTIEWVRKPTPIETGYVEGVNGDQNNQRLLNGLGHEVWRERMTNTNVKSTRAALQKAAADNGIKVLIGLDSSQGAGQISVLDRSLIHFKTTRVLGESEGHPFHGNQYTDRLIERVAKNETEKAELEHQRELASKQTNPHAHPPAIIGLTDMVHHSLAENYVAAYGEEFKTQALPKEYELSAPNECYRNASLLVVEHDDLTYAEGFATKGDSPLSIVHAWTVDKAGNVIDNTLPDPENWSHFGVKYNREKYLKYLYRAKKYGVLGSTDKNANLAMRTGGKRLR